MTPRFSVSLQKIINELNLKIFYAPRDPNQMHIFSMDINRPGLQLGGFLDYFDVERIQVMGMTENAYLRQFPSEHIAQVLDSYFALKPPAVILSRDIEPLDEMLAAAEKHGIFVLGSDDATAPFTAALLAFLAVELAPRVTRHGVLIEVYGEGILLLGDSGVGKSETAIELVKRGHRLIADDAVEIRRVSNKTLVGSSPENIRHFLELRGVGIINVRRLFGMGAIKMTEKIDMVIQLEQWDQSKVYDRMGMENEFLNILDLKIPAITIPIKPGRNLAIIIEVAAMNNRQKKMGYNAAAELLERLGMAEDIPDSVNTDWDSY
ncbi:MAG: HPr(Ser) kinase/phosphatase [Oscillospiraceae bacterium]|nr:HPr(Ser) kinase/phosphatase [Oscillospiraceae bacterium]